MSRAAARRSLNALANLARACAAETAVVANAERTVFNGLVNQAQSKAVRCPCGRVMCTCRFHS
eukprot:CAMPEP_0202859512 /NCGR_PEP_ID=MMETSP1391-20130828/1592_1 /ASSEMBLY_ACC=CAM_ASM_000867 /TAXON_ID=1034604 /ORGANISM="Chlamydomonas leiostraca, Strain SAG 11-49" /LENGTH=62 /DNA_ID=CAMNT_0049538547 /DNA_START=108 /DNA_END=292 /DNA_ORIENTATION=+